MTDRIRYRIRFRKQGDLRLIGHRDLLRTLERLFRRAGIRLGMSEGFHPKPRMSFPLALALGMEGAEEVMELELAETLDAEELLARLRAQAPEGLLFQSVRPMPPGAKKAEVGRVTLETPVPEERRGAVKQRIEEIWSQSSYPLPRSEGKRPVDLRRLLHSLELCEGRLRVGLSVTREGSVRGEELLALFGLDDLSQRGQHWTRTRVELNPSENVP